MRHHANEPSFRDPVCGMETSRRAAVAECTYLGKAYYFCAGECRAAFEADPERYLRHRREHGT